MNVISAALKHAYELRSRLLLPPCQDWLVVAYKRVSGVEYALLVGTLLSIMGLGLEAGIGVSIVAAALHFANR